MIGRALEIAWNAHKGQTDKAGNPYIRHERPGKRGLSGSGPGSAPAAHPFSGGRLFHLHPQAEGKPPGAEGEAGGPGPQFAAGPPSANHGEGPGEAGKVPKIERNTEQ